MAQQKKAAPGGRFAELRAEVSTEPYVLTDEIKIPPMSRSQVEKYLAATNMEEKFKVMFGDQYEAIKALFADEHHEIWTAFVREIGDFMWGKKADDVPGGSSDSSSG